MEIDDVQGLTGVNFHTTHIFLNEGQARNEELALIEG